MAENKEHNNAQNLFGVHQIPSDKRIREFAQRGRTISDISDVLGDFQSVGANGSLIRFSVIRDMI
ncbi:hypothetical protein [Nostoc sp.]|uniref:hypothetical protein n=1 Tax=Nostoc sp. TaxID=1180 RepID=UPI002FFB03B4